MTTPRRHAAGSPSKVTRPRVDPVGLFFGPTAPGPFALLDLAPSDVEPVHVLEALHRRIEQLARHPQAATPGADEVRLALHAAAAQLCDPAARRFLLGMWAPEHAKAELASGAPADWGGPLLGLERDLHVAVGLSGGWNQQAMSRLSLACRARGASVNDVLQLLAHVSRRDSAVEPAHRIGRPRTPERAASHAPRRSRRLPPARLRRQPSHAAALRSSPARDFALLAALAFVGFVLVAVAIIFLTPPRSVRPATTARDLERPAELPLRPREDRPDPVSEADVADDLSTGSPRVITREIAGSTQDLETDAKAARARFERAYAAFGRSWTTMSPDELTSIVSAIVDFSYVASRQEPDAALVLTTPLRSAPADKNSVRAFAAAVGVSARLLSERDLARAFLDQLESGAVLAGSSRRIEKSASFRNSVERFIGDLAVTIDASNPQTGQAWTGFIDVRDSVLGDRQPAKDLVAIGALDLVLRNRTVGPRELVRSVSILAGSLSWNPGEELRSAFFVWLEDSAIPGELIAELTRVMVSSSAPGVDSTMSLLPTAGSDARSALRERLEQVWASKPSADSSAVISSWREKATRLLAERPGLSLDQLRLAADLSDVAVAGDLIRQGKGADAESVLEALVPNATTRAPLKLPDLPRADPRSLALEFAAAGTSVQARLEILKRVPAAGTIPDPLLARLLVTEASRGSPAQIRDAARAEIKRLSSSVSILLATFEALRSIPETRENADWVSEVAGKSGAWSARPKWKGPAAVALAERACEAFPASRDEAEIDSLATRLGASWLARSGNTRSASQRHSPSDAIDRLEVSLASGARAAPSAPQGLSPSEIRKRLIARLAIAPTVLERAVVYQAACVEWTALTLARDQSRDAGAIKGILDEWNNARRSAQSSFEQLLEGERATVRLQLLRFREGAKS